MSKILNQNVPAEPMEDQEGMNDETSKEPKKPNVFKRGWGKVKATAKAIKDNPVASAVCAIAGALTTVGVGLLLESRKSPEYISIPAPTDDGSVEQDDETETYDEAPAEEAEVE